MLAKLKNNILLSGSLIMIFGSFFTSFINYTYHLMMGRLLGPVSYGEVASLVSVVSLLALLPTSLGVVITKLISQSKTDQEIVMILRLFNKWIFILGIFVFILMALFSPAVAAFLNIDNVYLIWICILIFIFSFPASITRAILQGLLHFQQVVLSQLTENGLRLVIAIVLVLIGLSATGALISLAIGMLFSWFLAWYYIKRYLKTVNSKSEGSEFNYRQLLGIFFPVLLLSLSFNSLYSLDLILVKHFFSSYQAGLYAALSFLGRIIFFGVSPITAVMFPMVAKLHARGDNFRKIILLSLLAAIALSSIITLFYGLIPNLAIKVLYGSQYLPSSPLLFWFGVSMSFITISFLLANYGLAIGKNISVILPFIAAFLQVLGILLYHNSLFSVIMVTLIDGLLLVLSLLYYLFIGQNKKRRINNNH